MVKFKKNKRDIINDDIILRKFLEVRGSMKAYLMQKILKWTFITGLSFLFFLSFNPWARGAFLTKSTESFNLPVVLKMNRYYILSIYPKPPYVDTQNRLIVPLKTVCDLIGAKVNYDPQTKTALINWTGHKIKLTVGSKTAFLDEKQVEMDTVPVLYKNAMLIPIKILIDGLKIKATWNQEYHITHLEDGRIMKSDDFLNVEDLMMNKFWNREGTKENVFAPLSYKIEMNYGREHGMDKNKVKLEVTAKNISGEDIPQGKTDIRPIYIENKDGSFESTDYLGLEGKLTRKDKSPPVKTGEIIKENFYMGIYYPDKKYEPPRILLWCGTW